MADKLRKAGHPIYPDGGYSGYMMAVQAFFLFNAIPWKDPVDVGTFFKVPLTAITDTDQKSEERQWQALKYFRDKFNNVRTAVLTLMKRVIDPAYHLENMDRQGFGKYEPPAILARLQHLYGQPSLGDIDTDILHINNPMDLNQPVDVMLRATEEVQMFLLAHPKAVQELADTNLISYTLIKLNKTGGVYAKSL